MNSNVQGKGIKFRICAVLLALLILVSPLSATTTYAEGTDTAEQTENHVNSGLVEENGKLYYYSEDGSLFKNGYKEVTVNGKTQYYYFTEDGSAYTNGYKQFTKNGKKVYYYFQKDGSAYTSGYLNFSMNGKQYYFYFTNDGSAYTSGYKEVKIDGKNYGFYFLPNGQAFNTGYKTVMIDGVKRYFYFGSNGRAVTDSLKAISFGSRTAYFLFQKNGMAYTDGYKEINSNGKTSYYYFLKNGQAFTTGYKTVKIDGKTYYFFFGNDGKAFTGGLKSVKFGSTTYKYYFQNNGRAYTSGWKEVSGKRYYFQTNGQMATNAKVGGSYVDANGVWEPTFDSMLKKAQGYSSSTKYLLLVDTNACRVGVYEKNGSEWANKYYWKCAPGAESTPTIKGTFTVAEKGYFFDSGSSRCFYYTQFSGNYLFHSVLYSQRSTDPAKAGVIDGTIGQKASHGCVRLQIENAKWIYDNVPRGTKVVTY